MKNNKNLWIGLGVLVVIIAIILIATLTGKKDADTLPSVASLDQTVDTIKPVSKGTSSAPARATFSMITPKSGSTLTRGTAYTVSWTGDANCYDLGYAYNPKQDTPYNFIGKVCENKKGVFTYKWMIPLNVQPGNYGLELKNSGTTGQGTNSVSFILK